jgi:hypothetical protein
MPEEFEGDLNEAVFWGAELKGATFRDVDLTGARITHAFVVDVEIDAYVDRLVVNGVDVTDYVNEHDPWSTQRRSLRARTTGELQAAVAEAEEAWASTIALARGLPDDKLHESVDGEFSFVETLRHMVFAIDKWFTAPVLNQPFDAMGLPNRGSLDFPWPGLEYDVRPSTDHALAVLADRMARVDAFVGSPDVEDADRIVDVLENGPHSVRDCIGVVVEEGFWHNRYARRDLAKLGAADDN